MRKTKSYKLETILAERIMKGDYTLLDFPAERKLAAAFQVTQMTARKAVKNLERRGLLQRRRNGSVTAGGRQSPVAVFLAPTILSTHVFHIQHQLARSAEAAGWQLRTVLYQHWDDAVVEEALERFNGVFLYPVREPLSERMTELLRRTETPVLTLGIDLTGWGIPVFRDQPENAVESMVDFLEGKGYRKIDFLLTQPRGEADRVLLEQWRSRLASHGLSGECFEDPVESYGDSYEQAFRFVSSLLDRKKLQSRCLLGATMAEAIGACRALASRGIRPGLEFAVSCVHRSCGGVGDYYIPSIAGVDAPDGEGVLREYFDWMADPEHKSIPMTRTGGPGRVFAGESVVSVAALTCMREDKK